MAERVDLDELARLDAEGTATPWKAPWPSCYVDGPSGLPKNYGTVTRSPFYRREDAILTVAARNALPALLAAVRAGLALAESDAALHCCRPPDDPDAHTDECPWPAFVAALECFATRREGEV